MNAFIEPHWECGYPGRGRPIIGGLWRGSGASKQGLDLEDMRIIRSDGAQGIGEPQDIFDIRTAWPVRVLDLTGNLDWIGRAEIIRVIRGADIDLGVLYLAAILA